MDTFVNEKDYKIIDSDRLTFFVLKRIIGGECRVLLSDHERLIICHTENPFPVWIWTPDDATIEELEKAYQLVKESCPFDEGYTFNIKYKLAEYFIKRASEEGITLKVQTNMFAYDCPDPIKPGKAEGELHKCKEEDIDELVDFYELFHNEIGIDKESREKYRQLAEEGVKNGALYLWKNAEGRFVSSCTLRPGADNLASVGLVYTRDEDRRHHYAENLVYEVTVIGKEKGFLPMLYTDADYIASNACYEKIGYIKRGELCTIG